MRFDLPELTIRGNTTLTINDLATSEFHDKEDGVAGQYVRLVGSIRTRSRGHSRSLAEVALS